MHFKRIVISKESSRAGIILFDEGDGVTTSVPLDFITATLPSCLIQYSVESILKPWLDIDGLKFDAAEPRENMNPAHLMLDALMRSIELDFFANDPDPKRILQTFKVMRNALNLPYQHLSILSVIDILALIRSLEQQWVELPEGQSLTLQLAG